MIGLMLGCGTPMAVSWGPGRTLIYNDAYAELIGTRHPLALGRSSLETFVEIRDLIEDRLAQASAGTTVHVADHFYPGVRRGGLGDAWLDICYHPVRSDRGEVLGVFITAIDTTARVLAERGRRAAETELRRTQARQAFLLKLSDALTAAGRSDRDPGRRLACARRAASRQPRSLFRDRR